MRAVLVETEKSDLMKDETHVQTKLSVDAGRQETCTSGIFAMFGTKDRQNGNRGGIRLL